MKRESVGYLAIVRVFFILVAGWAVNVGFAQQITKLRTFTADPPVTESTLNVFPQITEGFTDKPMRPANPSVQGGVGPANQLKFGRNRNVTRGKVGPQFPGIGATGWTPPDPKIAVGPNHIVQVVNSSLAFFNKATGVKTFQQDLGPFGFFGSLNITDFVFDPKCFYDAGSGRFFVVALEMNDSQKISKCLVAVSDDSDPNGNWFKYRIESKISINNTEAWLDYPGFGYNKDGVVITGNMFAFGGQYAAAQLLVMRKSDLTSGATPTVTSFIDTDSFTIQPAITMDANTDTVFGVSQQTTSSMRLFAVRGFTTTPTVEAKDVTVPSFTYNIDYADSTNGALLDTVAFRCMNAAYRGGRLVACHTIGVSNNDPRPSVRWYEFAVNQWPNSGNPSLTQSGQVTGSAGESVWMPDISINKFNDIAIVASRSSTGIAADLIYVGRKVTDPPGTMGKITVLATSNGNFGGGPHRWGDYAGCMVDPLDDTTFWGVAETIRADGNWSTNINQFTITAPGGGDLFTIQPDGVVPLAGTVVNGTLTQLKTADDAYFHMSSALDRQLGQVASFETTFTLTVPVGSVSEISLTVENHTTPGTNRGTGMLWIYDWTKQQYQHVKSFSLRTNTDASVSVTLSSNLANFVDGSGKIKVATRALVPFKRVRGKIVQAPQPFGFKTDLVQVSYVPTN